MQYIYHTTLKVNCLVPIIRLLELFIVFNSFQPPSTVSLWHFYCLIQEMDIESSSSKQGNFSIPNTVLGEFLAGRSFRDIS